jgi:LUC7 N_terminus
MFFSAEMFVNTKMDDGPCELVHSEELKEKFERDNDPYMYDALIERDFLTRINDIDRSIKVLSQNIITIYNKKLIF